MNAPQLIAYLRDLSHRITSEIDGMVDTVDVRTLPGSGERWPA